MIIPVPEDLNMLRRARYGNSASLTFYMVSPTTGEQPTATLTDSSNGWFFWGLGSSGDRGVTGSLKIIISSATALDVGAIRQAAAADLNIDSQTKRYRIADITETQQRGSGWVIWCEPLSNTI
jgi:hypothetical protein